MSLDQEVAFNFQQLNVGASAVQPISSITSTEVGGEQTTQSGFRMVITCETNQVRFRYDGGVPTATSGHLLNVGDILVLEGRYNILQFQAIATGANATLMITLETM